MLILSIHLGHNSSICVFNNGNVEKYFLVERFTRKKYDYNKELILKLVNDICSELKIDVICISNFNTEDEFISKIFEESKKYHSDVKLDIQSDHHLNHASLAFYNSKFEESLVIVVDGAGSTIEDNLVEVESVFFFNNEKNTLIYKNVIEEFSPFDLPWESNVFSVGGLYDMASVLIGNTPDDCGKAMGLSSYGDPNPVFEKLFDNFYQRSDEEIQTFLKSPSKLVGQLHADLCYGVQQQTQIKVGNLIEDSIKRTGIKKVCISGGYGMNIVSNYYYLQRFPEVEFYFEPLCNDNGVSIGAAMNTYLKLTNKIPTPIKNTFFHGNHYDCSLYQGVETSIEEIAELLCKNKSIGVYSGLSEAGQRALGNRSILFSPLNPEAKNILNEVKRREWYRPFAAVVLEKDVDLYFDNSCPSPHMTLCFPVKSDMIPGVTHVDGTCRVQTVSSGHLYDILKAFKNLTGHGILLNTSLNLAGEPLAETPKDAFDTLNNSSLDYLWFEETKQLFEK